MAQKVQILLVDDLDGSEASDTVEFAFDGNSYEIDLSEANAAAMREAFAVYVAEARKIGARRGGRAKTRATRAGGTSDAGEVREWARANGYQVSDRGRVSAKVRTAYDAAH